MKIGIYIEVYIQFSQLALFLGNRISRIHEKLRRYAGNIP